MNMQSKPAKYGLGDDLVEAIVIILKQNPKIEEVLLFGSRAQENYHKRSDINLALKGENIKMGDRLNAMVDLDKLGLPLRFDLRIYDRITAAGLRRHIDEEGIVLNRKLSSHD